MPPPVDVPVEEEHSTFERGHDRSGTAEVTVIGPEATLSLQFVIATPSSAPTQAVELARPSADRLTQT